MNQPLLLGRSHGALDLRRPISLGLLLDINKRLNLTRLYYYHEDAICCPGRICKTKVASYWMMEKVVPRSQEGA